MTENAAPSPEPTDTPLEDVATLKAALADAEARAAAAKDAQLRATADLDNTRRRLERDAANTLKYASEKLLGELLAVVDSLELGLKAAEAPDVQVKTLIEGAQLTHRQIMAMLEKHGVRQVDPQGEAFNPEAHNAVAMVESATVAPNHVLEVMQRGYKLHERLLRPAMVVVAKPPAAPAAGS